VQFRDTSIVSVQHVDAPHRISSAWIQAELAETMHRLGLPKDLLESLAGIYERRYWDEEAKQREAPTRAEKRMLNKKGDEPSKIKMIITKKKCRNYVEK